MSDSAEEVSLGGLFISSLHDLLRGYICERRMKARPGGSPLFLVASVFAMFMGLSKLAVLGALRSSSKKYRSRWALLDAAIRHAESAKLDGLWLEFGVASGSSLIYIANRSSHHVVGFDSFEGLPANWNPFFARGAFTLGGSPPKIPENVSLVKGLFDDTLPRFLAREPTRGVSFLHIDSDLYESAVSILGQLKGRLRNGTVIVFDEFCQATPRDEALAFREVLVDGGLSFEYLGCGARGTGSLPVALWITRTLKESEEMTSKLEPETGVEALLT